MYQELTIKSRVRVPPRLFSEDINQAVSDSIKEEFEGQLDQQYGLLLAFKDIKEVGDGVIIPGDGAIYYDTTFTMISYKPLIQELVKGRITEIAEFGAFAMVGPIEGLIHKSQVMNDFVSYSESGVLTGRDSGRVLKVGDQIIARIISASIKDLQTSKIGLTMRQEGLGVPEWYEEAKKK